MAEAEPKSGIQVIERLLTLLDAVAASPEPPGLKKLAQITGLHPSTAHRILNALVGNRVLDRTDAGSYRLGVRLIELGNLAKSRLDFRDFALPHMRILQAELGETVNLSIRQGDEIIYIERVVTQSAMMRVVQMIGARAPLHITAAGKLFLLEEKRLNRNAISAYAQRAPMPHFTKHSLTSVEALEAELSKVEKQGYATDNEEAENGVYCIASGIRDDAGILVAGLSISAPADRVKSGWANNVKDCALEISRAIGWKD